MSIDRQDPFHLALYTTPGSHHNFMNHFMISIGGLFFEMVRAAAVRVDARYNPNHSDYAKPGQYAGSDPHHKFADYVRSNSWFGPEMREFDADSPESDLCILLEYVKLINSQSEPNLLDDWCRPLVYVALARVQKHKCECILLTHAASGKNFGMDTNYQKVDAFAPVADWYERFNMSEYMSTPMEHVLLPKDRPGYYDEDVPA